MLKLNTHEDCNLISTGKKKSKSLKVKAQFLQLAPSVDIDFHPILFFDDKIKMARKSEKL